MSVKQDQKFF